MGPGWDCLSPKRELGPPYELTWPEMCRLRGKQVVRRQEEQEGVMGEAGRPGGGRKRAGGGRSRRQEEREGKPETAERKGRKEERENGKKEPWQEEKREEGRGRAGGGLRGRSPRAAQLRSALHACVAKFRREQFHQQHFTIQVTLITAGARWVGNSNKKNSFIRKKSSRSFENAVRTPLWALVEEAGVGRQPYRDSGHGPSARAHTHVHIHVCACTHTYTQGTGESARLLNLHRKGLATERGM